MREHFKKYYPIAVTVIITAVLTFMTSSAYYSGKLFLKPGGIYSFGSVEDILDKHYYGEYSKENAYQGALKGYVASLGDPYTVYMTADDMAEFNKLVFSNYCGIGVSVQNNIEDDNLLILEVFENSPASKAGIETGDVILKVDGVEYSGRQLDAATKAIQGEKDTEVIVTVLKKHSGEAKDVSVIRDNIEIDTVKSKKLDGNIGYVEITQFSTNTALAFTEQVDALMEDGIDSIIIDVRDNTGGITTAVESITDCLLPEDSVIYYTADKHGNKTYFKSKIDGIDIPLVVLANENSASASEILVGAVKDNKRGTVVGQKTFGKGVVQQIYELNDGTAVKVTIEKYFTPLGNDINGKGIEPDVVVDLEEDRDTQLEKAIEILKKR